MTHKLSINLANLWVIFLHAAAGAALDLSHSLYVEIFSAKSAFVAYRIASLSQKL
jgi:hypothetical protein